MRNLTQRDPAFLGASLLSVSSSPLLNMPFSVNRTLTDTVSGGSLITFSRPLATGTFVDSSGALQTAAADAARFDTDPLTLVSLGLLGEEARTNGLRNNTAAGAVAGTPGTNPTYWGIPGTGIANGLTKEIAGIGTVSGIAYIDIRYFGTVTSAGNIIIQPEMGTAGPAATSGQTWTASTWLALVSGSTTGLSSIIQRITGRSSAGGFLEFTDTVLTPTSTLTRYAATRALTNASTARVTNDISIGVSNGASVDFTFRLGLPQAEQGLNTGSAIITSSATVTRNADVADIISANAALIAAIRTLFVEFRSPAVGIRGVVSLNDGTANNRIEVRTNGTAVQVLIVTGGTTVTIAAGTITANARARLAVRLGAASSSASLNGAAPVAAAASRPTVDRAAIARSQANEYLNGTIATLTAWNQEFSDSMLVIQST